MTEATKEKTHEQSTMNELTINIGELVIIQGSILFPQYDLIKSQATNLANHLKQVEVNQDNLQKSKQLLAAVNKEVKKLHDERIKIKKTVMEPYDTFESQIKEITSIVKESDDLIRNQVRELEEQERLDKKKLIQSIFDKRIKHYDFQGLMDFDKFLKPTHLNKSTSMTKVENEMVSWLTKTETDLELIKSMEYSFEIIGEYQRSQDVASSIKSVMDRHKAIQEMERKVEVVSNNSPHQYDSTNQPKPKKPIILIELNDEKDARLVEMFMKQEGIEYSKTIK